MTASAPGVTEAPRSLVDTDVTAGEYGTDLVYFAWMCAAGAVDCLQVDLSRCGGITEWRRVAASPPPRAGGVRGLRTEPACAWPRPHPNLRHLEWFHDHVRIESRLLSGALDAYGGTVAPTSNAPGTGSPSTSLRGRA